MTVARSLVGFVLLFVAITPMAAGAWALRARLLGWVGVPARMVEVVVAFTTLVVVSELMGLVHLYRVGPLVVALAAAGGVELWWARRPSSRPSESPADEGARGPGDPVPVHQMGRWGSVLAVVAVSVLVADWAPRVIDAYHHGMTTVDTLWYHLPAVARFVQTGTVGQVQYFDGDAVTAFFPSNAELLHGLGVLTLASDVLSPLLNVLWLAVALAAAWSIGSRFQLGPLTLTGVVVVFATPGLVGTQPGGAYNDVASIGLLLAGFAILFEANRRGPPPLAAYALAGLAAGLAVGTKFTMLIAVVALGAALLVASPRGQRLRLTGVWVLGTAVTGSFWYVRNTIAVGNPLPALGMKVGPIELRNLSHDTATIASVSKYVFDGQIWQTYFLPGLGLSLGWGWWLLLFLVTVGAIAAVVFGPTRMHRVLGFVTGVSFVGFLFTQQILGPPGQPVYFGVNLRYVAPSLVLGLVAMASLALHWPVLRAPILGAYLLLLAAMQFDPTLWPTHILSDAFSPAISGIDSVLGALVGLLTLGFGVFVVLNWDRLGSIRARRWPVAIATAIAVILAIVIITPEYLSHRYTENPLFSWANDLHDQRIGLHGGFAFIQYPTAGRDLSNHVQFLGVEGTDGTFGPIKDCVTWRNVVNAGQYDWLFLTGSNDKPPPEWGWTSTDPAAVRTDLRDEPMAALFRIKGPLDPATCPKAGRRS